MKREILCVKCTKAAREMFPTDEPYPGEYVKFEVGLAQMDFVCDHCGCNLLTGQACSAMSIWTDRSPYFVWEHEYIRSVDDPAFIDLACLGMGYAKRT